MILFDFNIYHNFITVMILYLYFILMYLDDIILQKIKKDKKPVIDITMNTEKQIISPDKKIKELQQQMY